MHLNQKERKEKRKIAFSGGISVVFASHPSNRKEYRQTQAAQLFPPLRQHRGNKNHSIALRSVPYLSTEEDANVVGMVLGCVEVRVIA